MLERVERDRAYAAAALDAEIERYPQLDARERGLATELVYGTLRTRHVLRRELERLAPRGLDRTDELVRIHLMLAAYQILLLDRVPPFAAVDSAVELVREARGAKLAGFTNAVLRKLAHGGPRLDRARAVVESAPDWLRERLERDVGSDETAALLGAPSTSESLPPAVVLRVRLGREEPSWLAEAERGRVSPLSRLLRGVGDPRKQPGYAQGAFVVQEEGAQAVALALGVRPGERVLDACAGRGQKTSLFAEQLAGTGELWASDVHPAKLRALEREHARLGLPPPKTTAVDLGVGAGELPDDFDRVLVDAPCSGVGTLRRRPEIVDRLGPDDPARLAALAERILRRAVTRARPGGRVVFAVCSVLGEEAEDLVARVGDVLEPSAFDAPEIVSLVEAETTSFRLLPLEHGTDGYFVASFVKR